MFPTVFSPKTRSRFDGIRKKASEKIEQQVAIFDPETGEIVERQLVNGDGEAEEFYRSLPALTVVY